ncbi:hypothetical protein Pla123a_06850 [Posidoniimonas polymericola]|uniref:Uncharacterized protein n=1 Tax=Posidoniimonas polymericola TaxID=2528002 RepID=A0A5C5ZFB7_9BACT|nr:hypothetical protein [Posidoniimonas polymericola]TWT85878.1 hypothetical protein Pla123a_06850 [Posidoniimonas polymericola]
MSERERWIVYPLLFLALGAALRDKLIKQTSSERVIAEQLLCESIICDNLAAREVIQAPLVRADRVAAGEVQARGVRQNGQPVLSISPQYLPQFLQQLGQVLRVKPAAEDPPAAAADGAAQGDTRATGSSESRD